MFSWALCRCLIYTGASRLSSGYLSRSCCWLWPDVICLALGYRTKTRPVLSMTHLAALISFLSNGIGAAALDSYESSYYLTYQNETSSRRHWPNWFLRNPASIFERHRLCLTLPSMQRILQDAYDYNLLTYFLLSMHTTSPHWRWQMPHLSYIWATE